MAKDENGGAGTILLAFILGAVSGAAVALLYAPASGRETREYLGDKAEEAFRQSLLGSQGSFMVFGSNGLVGSIMVLGLIALFWPAIQWVWTRLRVKLQQAF